MTWNLGDLRARGAPGAELPALTRRKHEQIVEIAIETEERRRRYSALRQSAMLAKCNVVVGKWALRAPVSVPAPLIASESS